MKNKILIFISAFMLAGCGVKLCLSTPKIAELPAPVDLAENDEAVTSGHLEKETLPPVAKEEKTKKTTVEIGRGNKVRETLADARISFVTEDNRHLHPFMSAPVQSGENLENPAAWLGEEMEFSVNYSFIRAGTAYIKAKGVIDTPLGMAYLVETTAKSAAVIDAVFKVRDINFSFISVKDFSSFGYSQSIREGHYDRDEWITFDAAKKTYSGLLSKLSGGRTNIDGELPGPVQDMLSSLFFMREQDLSGKTDIILDVTNREKTYPMRVKVLGRETVKTGAGKFNCVVVEPEFRGEGIFIQKGKSLKVWLTDDELKIPVKMEAKVFIGSVNAKLESYKKN